MSLQTSRLFLPPAASSEHYSAPSKPDGIRAFATSGGLAFSLSVGKGSDCLGPKELM